MVTPTGQLAGGHVRAEVHGPHDVRGDSVLIATALKLINQSAPVYGGILVGGGIASF